jgi:hypothetical protein
MVDRVLERGASWINRRLKPEDIRGFCALVLVIYLLMTGISFVTAARHEGQTIFGQVLGADFPAFYVAGKIINEYGTARLYDRDWQAQLYLNLFPFEESNVRLPYLNAPFFVLPFPLLAKLPYAWAYLIWFLVSLRFVCGRFQAALAVAGGLAAGSLSHRLAAGALVYALSGGMFGGRADLGVRVLLLAWRWYGSGAGNTS